MNSVYEKAYEICIKKIAEHMRQIDEAGELYEYHACLSGDYYKESTKTPFNDTIWTPSFFTGLPALAFKTHNDLKYIRWSNKHAVSYKEKIFKYPLNTHHDLGFIYSPFSVALYKLTGDSIHKEAALRSADELLKRFNIRGGFIEAWDRMDSDDIRGISIIDCMMNLALLFWAWKETGNVFYKDIAAAHADHTLKRFVREDGTVHHAVRYIEKENAFVSDNYCGYAVNSKWARGMAWAVYGFAIAYGYTRNELYLEASEKIADSFVNELKEEDFIPVWDFKLDEKYPARMCRLPDIKPDWDETDPKNKIYNRDTSAAAITVSGILEIYKYKKVQKLTDAADKILESLCSDKYFNNDPNIPGILKYSNGKMSYTAFGDYFFVEALQKRLYNCDICW